MESDSIRNMKKTSTRMKQGDVFLANLNPAKGYEQAGYRPVLILQNDFLNKNLTTAIIAPITSNLKAKGLLTTYFLQKEKSFLDKDSVILLFQMRTLDKSRLTKKISNIGKKECSKIKEQFKFIF